MKSVLPIHEYKNEQGHVDIDRICKENEHMFYPAHRHNFYEIIYFIRAKGKQRIDFASYPTTNHQIYCLAPGQIHEMQTDQKEGLSIAFSKELMYQIMSIENTIFANLFHHPEGAKSFTIPKEKQNTFKSLFFLLEEESQKIAPNDKLLRNYLSALLLLCLEIDSPQSAEKRNHRIDQLILEINRSFRNVRNVQYYADQLNVSTKYLNEISKKQLNKTVTQLIHERMILEAKRELAYTHQSIKEIAFALGFNDPAYFNRFFKKMVKSTPETFRKSSR